LDGIGWASLRQETTKSHFSAELFKRKGDTFKVKEQQARATDLYKECGADGWVTRAEEELARLS